MDKEDLLHQEIRDWMEEQGWVKDYSLDELIAHDANKRFMSDKQRVEAKALMERFYEL